MRAASRNARPAASISASTDASRAGSSDPSSAYNVRDQSRRRSVATSPSAENAPGAGGMITSGIASSSARNAACTGPAPPKAISANSAGSCPRSTETMRSACAMLACTTATMRAAAARGSRPSGRADLRHDRGLCRFAVDRQRAAEQGGAVEPAQHHVGVGHRGQGSAAPVGGGTRVRPGAARADFQRPAGIDPGDGAAAGADFRQIDHRHPDRVAGAVHPAIGVAGAAHLVFGGHRHLAAGDQARLGGGAAHVETQQVGATELATGERGGDHPGGGARFHRRRRHRQRRLGLHDPAAGAHHVQARQAEAGDRILQPAQVGGEQRADHGADRGGAGALELADLGQHLGGEEHPHIGQCGAQGGAKAAFVAVVEEGEQQADGDRFHPGLADRGDQGGKLIVGKRGDDRALGVDPLGDLEAVAARDQHRGRVLQQVVEIGARRAAQFQDVAEAARGHEGRATRPCVPAARW